MKIFSKTHLHKYTLGANVQCNKEGAFPVKRHVTKQLLLIADAPKLRQNFCKYNSVRNKNQQDFYIKI